MRYPLCPEQQLLTLAAYFSSLNRYDAVLKRWLEFYPREQFYVGFFDSVSNSPGVVLSRIVRFLCRYPIEAWRLPAG